MSKITNRDEIDYIITTLRYWLHNVTRGEMEVAHMMINKKIIKIAPRCDIYINGTTIENCTLRCSGSSHLFMSNSGFDISAIVDSEISNLTLLNCSMDSVDVLRSKYWDGHITSCIFENSTLDRLKFKGSIIDSNFNCCDLSSTRIDASMIVGDEFVDCRFNGLHAELSKIEKCTFKRCVFDLLKFTSSEFDNCEFIECEFTNSRFLMFDNSIFKDCSITNCTGLDRGNNEFITSDDTSQSV